MKKIKLGCGLVVALFAAMLIGMIIFGPKSDPSPPPAKKALHPLSVRVGFDETSITLTNEGSPTWKSASLFINGTPPDGYRIMVGAPAVGAKVRIPLRDFARKDGARFSPAATVLTVIWVGGDEFDFTKFNAR